MPDLIKFSAPSVSLSPPTSLSSIGKTSLPSLSSPNISIGAGGGNPLSLNSMASNANVPTSLSGAAASFNVPTTAGGISSAFGGPTSLQGGLNSLGVSTQLPNVSSVVNIPQLNLPKMVNFPGLDAPGIALGAGPKFLAEKVAKLKTIVPPFVPGLKLNMGMIAGALAVIKAMSSANPGELLKQITQNIVDDLKDQAGDIANQAIDSTGISNVQDQLNGIQGSAQGAMDSATQTAQEATSGATSTIQGAASEATSGTTVASNPVTSAVSSATSTVNDKISAFSFPPTG